jgi:hypothetical protein
VGAYLAVGDSVSIDYYTGLHGGGAASQLARKLRLELVDLTVDANTTHGVLADLTRAPAAADIVTLTAGGNDLLGGDLPQAILRPLHQIARRIEPLGARIAVNTVYDPSDGDSDLGRRELGLSWLVTIELRRRLNAFNRGIAELAAEHHFLLADLERLFHGHGLASEPDGHESNVLDQRDDRRAPSGRRAAPLPHPLRVGAVRQLSPFLSLLLDHAEAGLDEVTVCSRTANVAPRGSGNSAVAPDRSIGKCGRGASSAVFCSPIYAAKIPGPGVRIPPGSKRCLRARSVCQTLP